MLHMQEIAAISIAAIEIASPTMSWDVEGCIRNDRTGLGAFASAATEVSITDAGFDPPVVAAASHGERKLYTDESAEVYFFDRGGGQLVGGVAVITLDPIWLETVTIDAGRADGGRDRAGQRVGLGGPPPPATGQRLAFGLIWTARRGRPVQGTIELAAVNTGRGVQRGAGV